MHKLDGMPRPNIINLKECDDRREYIIEEFKQYGVNDILIHSYDRYENSNVKFIGHDKAIGETPKGVTSSHLLTIKHWLETTDAEWGIFFEDDVDLSTINYWNGFNFTDIVNRFGTRWECLHLCGIFESLVALVPRKRETYDFGLQAYIMKRKYASKLVKFYFTEPDPYSINFRMPHGYHTSTENNILGSFGITYTFPFFNHNIFFKSKNHHTTTGEQLPSAVYAQKIIQDMWKTELLNCNLEEIFDHFRVAHLSIRYEKIRYEQQGT